MNSVKYISQGLTLIDMAQAFEADAKDTASKLQSFLFNLQNAYQGHDYTTVGTTFQVNIDLVNDIRSTFGNGVTIPLSNGKLVQLNTFTAGSGTKMYLQSTRDGSVSGASPLIEFDLVMNYATVVGTTIVTVDNSTVSVSDFINEISDATSTELVIQRLTSLVTSGNEVNFQNVSALLSGINLSPNASVSSLVSAVRDLGTATSAPTLLALIHDSFKRSVNLEPNPNDDVIVFDFDNTDYAVNTHIVTTMAGLALTATQAIGSLLVAFGGSILKVVGVGLSLLGTISSYVANINTAYNINATYDGNAPYNHYAAPIVQLRLASTSINSEISAQIALTGICRIEYPGMILFLWTDPKDDTYVMLEGYLNLVYDNVIQRFDHYTSNPLYSTYPAWMVYPIAGPTVEVMSSKPVDTAPELCNEQYAYNWGYMDGNASRSVFTGSTASPTDAELLHRACFAATHVISLILQLRAGIVPSSTGTLNFQVDLEDIEDGYSWAADGSYSLKTQLAHRNITKFMMDMVWLPYYHGDAVKYPSWANFQNCLIASIKWLLETIFAWPRYLLALAGETGDWYPRNIAANMYGVSLFHPAPVVTPPNYDANRVWLALALTAAAIVTISAAAVITTSVLERKWHRVRLQKLTDIEAKKYEYENETMIGRKEILWEEYTKMIKEYNLWALTHFQARISWATGELMSNSFTSSSTLLDKVQAIASKAQSTSSSYYGTYGDLLAAQQETTVDLTAIEQGVDDITHLIR